MNTSKNILLVEDDDDDQFFFTEAISEIRNAILFKIAKNGKEALEILKTTLKLPDLIFLDINMPVMSGIELLSELIKIQELKNIPVIILSTGTTHVEVVRNLGAKAYIKKPTDPNILRCKLEEIINLDFNSNIDIANQTFDNALNEE